VRKYRPEILTQKSPDGKWFSLKISGKAYRAPVRAGSIAELNGVVRRATTAGEVRSAFRVVGPQRFAMPLEMKGDDQRKPTTPHDRQGWRSDGIVAPSP